MFVHLLLAIVGYALPRTADRLRSSHDNDRCMILIFTQAGYN
jgi:hypothetical protein